MSLCWTVDDVRKHLGLSDSSDPDIDAKVEQAMAITLSTIERYCNRLFAYRVDHEETVYKQYSNGWQLHLWPVEGNQISIDGKPASSPKVDNQTGVAWFGGYEHVEMCDVTYTGGYEPCDFPPDLLAVLVGSITHAFEITSGGASASDSPISKVTIPDVGTVTYDVKSSNSLISYIGGIIPAYYQSVLDLYRLHEC